MIAGPYGFGWIAGENISAVYDFEGGGTVFAEFHRRSESNRGWGHIKIYGEDGAICLYNQMNMQVRRGRDWRVEDVNWELLELSPADRILHGVDYLDEPGGDLWMADETVHALDQDRPHENSGEEGLAVMEMLLGAWESHFTERRVRFPMRRGAHHCCRRGRRPAWVSRIRRRWTCAIRSGFHRNWPESARITSGQGSDPAPHATCHGVRRPAASESRWSLRSGRRGQMFAEPMVAAAVSMAKSPGIAFKPLLDRFGRASLTAP